MTHVLQEEFAQLRRWTRLVSRRRWLVLGVTPHTINLLHTMEPTPDAVVPSGTPVAGTAAASFAQMLGRVRGNPSGADREP